MDAWDYLMMGSILLFIGSILISGALSWAWKRFRPIWREIFLDWKEFRTSRRVARKREEYILWKEGTRRLVSRGH